MSRINHYFRTVFQILAVGVLGSLLTVLRLIRSIFGRKIKKAEEAEVKVTPVAGEEVAPVISLGVEAENKTVEVEGDILALEAVEAYCVKCRQKRTIQGARKVTTKTGRSAIEGTCPVCGRKLFRFIAREKENLPEEG